MSVHGCLPAHFWSLKVDEIDPLDQWFPTEVPLNTRVPQGGARGAATSDNSNFSLCLYTYRGAAKYKITE